MRTIYIDVMVGERFIKTLPYKHHDILRLDEEKLREYVLSKMPTLRDKDFEDGQVIILVTQKRSRQLRYDSHVRASMSEPVFKQHLLLVYNIF